LNRVFPLSNKNRQKNRFTDSRLPESAQHYTQSTQRCQRKKAEVVLGRIRQSNPHESFLLEIFAEERVRPQFLAKVGENALNSRLLVTD
jgi:hypothetical protein